MAAKPTTAQKPSRRPARFSRVIKTGNKVSKGKIAIIVVSLAALGTIFAAVSFAGFNTGTITATNPLTKYPSSCHVFSPNGVYAGLQCSANTRGIAWYGPFQSYTINAPSGENIRECALINNSGDITTPSYPVTVHLDMSSDFGRIVWGTSQRFNIPAFTTTPVCFNFKIPSGGTLAYALRLSNVEFRVYIDGGNNAGNMLINSVSATTTN